AIGHEVDISLAELAADQRASTPSNAAELLVPDRRAILASLNTIRQQLERDVCDALGVAKSGLTQAASNLHEHAARAAENTRRNLELKTRLLAAYDPSAALQRGYALVRSDGSLVRSGKQVIVGDELSISLSDAH